jgi:AcrR family transcriptional regulator
VSEDGSESRRAKKKVQSRRRILDAARDIFFSGGFMHANLDDVANRAGVAKGTLYRYFDSKADLYVAVLAENGEIFAKKMRECVAAPELEPPDLIRRLGRFYFEHWTTNREYFQIFWALENQSVIGELPAGVVDEVTKLWEQCVQILAEIVAAGVERGFFRDCDPWEVSDILWTLANGVIQTETSPAHRRLRRRSVDLTFTDAVDLVLEGLAAKSNRG